MKIQFLLFSIFFFFPLIGQPDGTVPLSKQARFFKKVAKKYMDNLTAQEKEKDLQSSAIFQDQKNIEKQESTECISNTDTIENLHVINGSFFQSIAKETTTYAGKSALLKTMIAPTNQKDILLSRQTLLRHFADNPELV